MPKTREVPAAPLPPFPDGYDPERAEQIRKLIEELRAATDEPEKQGIFDQLDELIFGLKNAHG